MTRARGVTGVATAALVVVALGACSGGDEHGPNPNATQSTTSSPAPTASSSTPPSETEIASEAASDVVRAYFATVDLARQDAKRPESDLDAVASSTQLAAQKRLLKNQRESGRRQVGDTKVVGQRRVGKSRRSCDGVCRRVLGRELRGHLGRRRQVSRDGWTHERRVDALRGHQPGVGHGTDRRVAGVQWVRSGEGTVRRVLTLAVTVAALASGLIILMVSPAHADTTCGQTDPATGECLVWIEVPGNPGDPGDPGDDGPKDTGSGASCYWDGSKQGISDPPPGPVPCNSEYGYWSNSYRCYIQYVDPQPGRDTRSGRASTSRKARSTSATSRRRTCSSGSGPLTLPRTRAPVRPREKSHSSRSTT